MVARTFIRPPRKLSRAFNGLSDKLKSSEENDLLEKIEGPSDKVRIWGLGGAGFAIRSDGILVYVDPYLSIPDPTRPFHRAIPVPFPPEKISFATAVISTHEHNDHCDPRTLAAFAKRTDAVFIGPASSARKAEASGYPSRRVLTVAPGETRMVSESLKLVVFPSNDLYEPNAVMYLIHTSGGQIFHSGDTSYFDGFRQVRVGVPVDVALLNFGRQIPDPSKPYYMDAVSVAMAARDLNARLVVPMHWNLWIEGKDDPRKVESELSRLSPTSEYRVLDVGQVLEL